MRRYPDFRTLGRGRYWLYVAGRRLHRLIDESRREWREHALGHWPWNKEGRRDGDCAYCAVQEVRS